MENEYSLHCFLIPTDIDDVFYTLNMIKENIRIFLFFIVNNIKIKVGIITYIKHKDVTVYTSDRIMYKIFINGLQLKFTKDKNNKLYFYCNYPDNYATFVLIKNNSIMESGLYKAIANDFDTNIADEFLNDNSIE